MSLRVLIIPEDPTLDQYILKPIVEKIFEELGKPTATVEVLQNPRLRGVSQALDREKILEIIDTNRMIDLFLLTVDRDCDRENNKDKAQKRQEEHEDNLIACLAIEEVEIWMLALHQKELGVAWKELRKECDPKKYAEDFLASKRWLLSVGKGRKRAMQNLSSASLGTIFTLCPEIDDLRNAIRSWLEQYPSIASK